MCHAGNANFVVVLKTKHKFQTSMKNTEKFKDSLAKLSFTGKKRERKRKKEEEEEEERLYGEKNVSRSGESRDESLPSSSSSCVFSFLLKSSLLPPLLPIHTHLFTLFLSLLQVSRGEWRIREEFGFNYSLITLFFVGVFVIIPLWVTLHVFDQFLWIIHFLGFFWSFLCFKERKNEGGTNKISVWNLFVW